MDNSPNCLSNWVHYPKENFDSLNWIFLNFSPMCSGGVQLCVACHKCWQQFLKFHSWNYYANAAEPHICISKKFGTTSVVSRIVFQISEVYILHIFHFLHIYIYQRQDRWSLLCLDVFYSQACLSNSHSKSWWLVIANYIIFLQIYYITSASMFRK